MKLKAGTLLRLKRDFGFEGRNLWVLVKPKTIGGMGRPDEWDTYNLISGDDGWDYLENFKAFYEVLWEPP